MLQSNGTLSSLTQLATLNQTFINFRNSEHVAVSVTALVIYEYLITFSLEVKVIWHSRFTTTKYLFLLNRYPYIIERISQLLFFFRRNSDFDCNLFIHIKVTAQMIVTLTLLGVFFLRTYAIYVRSRTVIFVLTIPSLCWIGSYIYSEIASVGSAVDMGYSSCLNLFDDNYTLFNAKQYLYFGSSTIWDTAVFVLTAMKTLRLTFEFRNFNIISNVTYILMRDGFIYYVVLVLTKIAGIVNLTWAVHTEVQNQTKISVTNILEYLVHTIQWILISRLILNLKNVTSHDTRTVSARGDRIPDNPFASGFILGNLGAPLRTYHDLDELDNELVEDGYSCIEETNAHQGGREGCAERNSDKILEV